MLRACVHALGMPIMLQVRNVPDALHRKLKARAAMEGLSLSDYVLRELERVASYPTREEVMARLAALPPVKATRGEIMDAIREARGERDGRSDA